MKQTQKADILKYVKDKYNISGDCPWAKYPEFVVLRHVDNKKWFGLIMQVPKYKLGLTGNDLAEVLNVKKDSVVIGGFIKQIGILPAYHMNKASWISILLDGSVPIKDVEFLLNVSFELTKTQKKNSITKNKR